MNLPRGSLVDRCPYCERWIQRRTEGQNGDLHALCTDMAEQLDWPRKSGNKIDAEAWKRLLMSAWERTHGRQAEFYPSLDCVGFDVVYRRTSLLSRTEMQEVLHFVNAWAANEGVVRTKSKRQQREEEEERALMDRWSKAREVVA